MIMACTCNKKGTCRDCLLSVEERNAIVAGPTVNGRGEFTLSQVENFEKAFRNSIVQEVNTNPLSAATEKYGNDLYNTVNSLNQDFLKRPYVQQILPDYPLLNERLKTGNVSPLEFSGFIENALYTPGTAIAAWNANGPRFLNEFENYLNNGFANSILGSFCDLFSTAYAAVAAFFNIIDSLVGLVQDAIEFINKIKNAENPLQALFDQIKVKALIEAIKEKIEETVKKIIEQLCQTIANFDIEAITGPLPNPSESQVRVIEDISGKKAAAQSFCGEENIERIKRKVRGLIDYAVGLFENPSVEEIIFLIARICGFAAGLERLINGLKDPLSNFSTRYQEVFNTLSNASNRITGEAIRAGAIRLSPEKRQELINKAKEDWYRAGNIEPGRVEEYRAININWDDLRKGKVPWLKVSGAWVTKMVPPEEGWTLIDTQVKIFLKRLHDKGNEEGIISGPITLFSGYRNPKYNRNVEDQRDSLHLQGTAVDITWSGYNPDFASTKYEELARRIGFRGVGYYNKFIHLDIGSVKSWDLRGTFI